MQRTGMGQCRGMLALSILLCGLVAPAMAQIFVYDDFSESLIDPARWSPNVSSAGNVYEMARQISGGELSELLVVNGGNRGGRWSRLRPPRAALRPDGLHGPALRCNGVELCGDRLPDPRLVDLDGIRGRAAHALQ
jgi:hypothetical protein